MNKLSLDVEAQVPASPCCECGYVADAVSGPRQPKPGDLTLCIRCGSLNAFDDELKLRKPTDEEYFLVAANSEFQRLRRIINSLPKEADK